MNTLIDEYKCYTCNVIQPVSNYHVNRDSKKGHVNICKDCIKVKTAKWYDKNKERKQQYNSEYRKDNWEMIKAKTYERRDKNKEKFKANQAVNNAITAGKLSRENCWCGELKTDFHHTDGYEKENWFTGIWLCRKHHAELHKELRRAVLKEKELQWVR